MKGPRIAALALALLALALFAAACGDDDDHADDIVVVDPWARESTNDVGAAYFRIINEGSEDDRLIAATSSLSPNVQLHEVVTEGASSRMQEVEGIDVPAGGEVELRPGGYHVMLLDLADPLEPGETVDLQLRFESGHTLTIEAEVRPLAEGDMGGQMQHNGSMGDR